MAWISSCSITTFDEGYQHHRLIPLRDHIVWFCVGVKDGPAKGIGCIQEFTDADTYLPVRIEMKSCSTVIRHSGHRTCCANILRSLG
jgi:hypothetical protein